MDRMRERQRMRQRRRQVHRERQEKKKKKKKEKYLDNQGSAAWVCAMGLGCAGAVTSGACVSCLAGTYQTGSGTVDDGYEE